MSWTLGSLTFFDPACGCGNFLIIAYRELRLLEIEVIREIRDATAATTQAVLDAAWQSVVAGLDLCAGRASVAGRSPAGGLVPLLGRPQGGASEGAS